MHHTLNIDDLGTALVDLMSVFSSPQRDEVLLREAGVELDRALFPLLVRLAARGPLGVAGLGAQVGRDHTTVSRQLAKLEGLGLVSRQETLADRRVRTAALTPAGDAIVRAITAARRRLLSKVLADWSAADLADLARLNRRFVDALVDAGRG
ncbi:MarR family winged helix-turn-helix transcriptional regulator [Phenylobacterium aquaticum]|uniref:MarR family winged helix-turn-helix transcriptional regulator n=1 Tax=Phenylobacterium aquaticum TaxID=1763816 RepID=UPI0026ECD614|nr:MarR family transcriptional regulator [Phenylobacterium aquaticum]